MTDQRYPLCSELGVLRKASRGAGERGTLIVSTAELLRKIGWKKYQRYLPLMEHHSLAGPSPESCERFLEGVNIEVKAL